MKPLLAIRMDDVFASSKQFEVYGRECLKIFHKKIPVSWISNLMFLKYAPGFRHRMPYRELTVFEWEEILDLLKKCEARMTVGITAAWIEKDCEAVPFYQKFSKEAEIIRKGLKKGLLEVGNHGYSHCVIGKHTPRMFASNRKYHREFWSWIPHEKQKEHLERSQKLLQEYFECAIETFIPPGNVWTEETEKIASEFGLRYLTSQQKRCQSGQRSNGLIYVGQDHVKAFHDRELVLFGTSWLKEFLTPCKDFQLVTVKEKGIQLSNQIKIT